MDSFTFTRFIEGDGFVVETHKIEKGIVTFRLFRYDNVDFKMFASKWVEKPLKDFIAVARFNGIQNLG